MSGQNNYANQIRLRLQLEREKQLSQAEALRAQEQARINEALRFDEALRLAREAERRAKFRENSLNAVIMERELEKKHYLRGPLTIWKNGYQHYNLLYADAVEHNNAFRIHHTIHCWRKAKLLKYEEQLALQEKLKSETLETIYARYIIMKDFKSMKRIFYSWRKTIEEIAKKKEIEKIKKINDEKIQNFFAKLNLLNSSPNTSQTKNNVNQQTKLADNINSLNQLNKNGNTKIPFEVKNHKDTIICNDNDNRILSPNLNTDNQQEKIFKPETNSNNNISNINNNTIEENQNSNEHNSTQYEKFEINTNTCVYLGNQNKESTSKQEENTIAIAEFKSIPCSPTSINIKKEQKSESDNEKINLDKNINIEQQQIATNLKDAVEKTNIRKALVNNTEKKVVEKKKNLAYKPPPTNKIQEKFDQQYLQRKLEREAREAEKKLKAQEEINKMEQLKNKQKLNIENANKYSITHVIKIGFHSLYSKYKEFFDKESIIKIDHVMKYTLKFWREAYRERIKEKNKRLNDFEEIMKEKYHNYLKRILLNFIIKAKQETLDKWNISTEKFMKLYYKKIAFDHLRMTFIANDVEKKIEGSEKRKYVLKSLVFFCWKKYIEDYKKEKELLMKASKTYKLMKADASYYKICPLTKRLNQEFELVMSRFVSSAFEKIWDANNISCPIEFGIIKTADEVYNEIKKEGTNKLNFDFQFCDIIAGYDHEPLDSFDYSLNKQKDKVKNSVIEKQESKTNDNLEEGSKTNILIQENNNDIGFKEEDNIDKQSIDLDDFTYTYETYSLID